MKHAWLVNPPVYDFKCYDEWMAPLGLLFLSHYLKKNKVRTSLLNALTRFHAVVPESKKKKYSTGDFYSEEVPKPHVYKDYPRKYKRYGMNPSMVKQAIQELDPPDVILITSYMTYWYPGIQAIIEEIQTVYPEVPILLGGIYATLCTSHAQRQFPKANIVPGRNLSNLNQEISRILGQPMDTFAYTDLLPDYSLLNRYDYYPLLLTSGCPFRCTYCASNFLDSQIFHFDQNKIKDSILLGLSNGIMDYSFYDDALLFQFQDHLKPMLDWVIQNRLEVRFHVPNALHVRYIDSEVADLLAKANFKTIRMGYETSNPRLQQQSGGKTTNQHFETAIKYLHQVGFTKYQIGAYVMVGMPGQALEDVFHTIEYLKSFPVQIKPVWFSPIPNTQLFTKLMEPFPEIALEPLLQNDSYYVIHSKFCTLSDMQTIKDSVKGSYAKLDLNLAFKIKEGR